MRIIAGANKGRGLKAPKWDGLRPTSDKLRETLFNILSPHVMDARVLDVFAGTGAIALEALSRGAAAATCVEQDRRAARLIEENRALCGEEERCVVIHDAVERALARPIPGGPFDIIVLDPPYDYPALATAVSDAATQRSPGAVLVLEHSSRVAAPSADGLAVTRTVKSGDSALSFYA